MVKRVFLVHGWDGSPDNCWFPWLRKELESRGFLVIVPSMPDSESPNIETWVPFLQEQIGALDENTYLVGHSIGCQTIMRALEGMDGVVGGLVFVAGFFNLPNLETEEEKEIAKPWLDTPIDTTKINAKYVVAVFSDDDEDVPLTDSKLFEQRLNAKVIIETEKGHFSDDDGVKELPVVLEELIKL